MKSFSLHLTCFFTDLTIPYLLTIPVEFIHIGETTNHTTVFHLDTKEGTEQALAYMYQCSDPIEISTGRKK
jgi:hypothetical protein